MYYQTQDTWPGYDGCSLKLLPHRPSFLECQFRLRRSGARQECLQCASVMFEARLTIEGAVESQMYFL